MNTLTSNYINGGGLYNPHELNVWHNVEIEIKKDNAQCLVDNDITRTFDFTEQENLQFSLWLSRDISTLHFRNFIVVSL